MKVVSFLLTVDLSNLNLSHVDFEEPFMNMTRLQSLTLTNAQLTQVPQSIRHLEHLQKLVISKNQIDSLLGDWFVNLKDLRHLNCRKNCLINSNIPQQLFSNSPLQVVDMSFNKLTEVPSGLLNTASLVVLNLSDNDISNIPKELFVNCASLMLIDLSNNRISTFPTNLRRMPNLQSLNLSNNPLTLAQLRSVSGLKKLRSLFLSNTSRRLDNFPPDLEKLSHLTELDISHNQLKKLPPSVFEIRSLIKLNVSSNQIDDMNPPSYTTECWNNLEMLNFNHNLLTTLPGFITRLGKLKKLYLDSNKLTFNGLPPSFGKLTTLELFSAAGNMLENIPEGLCRCGQLRHLNLRDNQLVTLPDAIHVVMESCTFFSIDNNPRLKMPPKLGEEVVQKKESFSYNIDFSLNVQMQLAKGATQAALAATKRAEASHKDIASRVRRLRKKRTVDESEESGQGQSSKTVLEGMRRVAEDKNAASAGGDIGSGLDQNESSNKKWREHIERPNLDYSRLFEDDVGQFPGLEVWDIDDFYPHKIEDEAEIGVLFRGDCYIVMDTRMEGNSISHGIYYWIGSAATLDKVTCAAMHAVHLRNFVGVQEGKSIREEEGDESDEFRDLFTRNGFRMSIVDGFRRESGFVKMERVAHKKKLYRVLIISERVTVYTCALTPSSLSSKHVYLLDDCPDRLVLWFGGKSSLMAQKKSRLLAEDIIAKERNKKADLIIEREGEESEEFRASLMSEFEDNDVSTSWKDAIANKMDSIESNWSPDEPIVLEVRMGKGIIHLSQVPLSINMHGKKHLEKSLLDKKDRLLIIQSNGSIFVCTGEKPDKFTKRVALHLVQELAQFNVLECNTTPSIINHKIEPYLFKTHFSDWKIETFVDFTRSADSIQKRGADLQKIMDEPMRVDLRAFFMPREKPVSWEEAENLIEEYIEDLVVNEADELVMGNKFHLKQFVHRRGKWVPVDQEWVGHFFSKDCFIVQVEYWEYPDVDNGNGDGPKDESDDETLVEPKKQTLVYFWRGRESNSIPWLAFNLTVLRESSEHSKSRVETKPMHQQQELPDFIAQFRHQFIIHWGSYEDRLGDKRRNKLQLFYMRDNGNPVCTRTVEVLPAATFMNSHFHYILKVPARIAGTDKDEAWCWLGEYGRREYDPIIEELAHCLYGNVTDQEKLVVRVFREGAEPDLMWQCLLGGNKGYDRDAPFLESSRLFRMTNEAGFFCASEKCADFCQDDLSNEDSMILDTGTHIFVWHGNRSSHVEQQLALKSAKLYKEHMELLQPDKARKLVLTKKSKEPHAFRRCFHGWGAFQEPMDWSG